MSGILCTLIGLLLLSSQLGDSRKINVGGGNRGAGAARKAVGNNPGAYNPQQGAGGYRPQQQAGGGYYPQQQAGGGYHPQQQAGGGYHPQQQAGGGYHPQQQAGGGYHPQQQGGYHQPNQAGFNNAGGGNTFKKALLGGALGAAGGIAAYELGKAILHSPKEPLNAANGQAYYFGEQNYPQKAGYFMCSMPLDQVVKEMEQASPSTTTTTTETAITDVSGSTVSPAASTTMSPEQFFKNVQFKDGSRPKSLTWSCKNGVEVCCGTDCCPVQQFKSEPIGPSRSAFRLSYFPILTLLGLFSLTLLTF